MVFEQYIRRKVLADSQSFVLTLSCCSNLLLVVRPRDCLSYRFAVLITLPFLFKLKIIEGEKYKLHNFPKHTPLLVVDIGKIILTDI